jgi:thiamine biosynthesis protein ThiS
MTELGKAKFTLLHHACFVGYIVGMNLVINGVAEELPITDATVAGVLAAKRWSFPLIIVKVNGVTVRRDAWARTAVSDGDVVEAAHLMSGG